MIDAVPKLWRIPGAQRHKCITHQCGLRQGGGDECDGTAKEKGPAILRRYHVNGAVTSGNLTGLSELAFNALTLHAFGQRLDVGGLLPDVDAALLGVAVDLG